MVVGGTANAGGVLDHDESQHTPEFKVWPEGQDEESRNSAASGQHHHVENAADLLSNIQQQPSTTTAMETSSVAYSSTIDMKDLGGSSASAVAVVVSTATAASWSGGSINSSNPVNTTAPTTKAVNHGRDPLANVITTSTGSGTTVDMNLLKWQGAGGGNNSGEQNLAPPRTNMGTKRSSSVDSPGHDEERLTVVEGDDSSQDSASTHNPAAAGVAASTATSSS